VFYRQPPIIINLRNDKQIHIKMWHIP